MNVGWLCPRCDAVNAPFAVLCGSCCGTATTAATTAATAASTANATAATAAATAATTANGAAAVVAHKGSKALEPKPPSTRKNRYTYTDPQFNSFWEVYPLKRGKAAAAVRFAAAVAAGVEPQRIIAAAAVYRDDPSRKDEFTKWPEGWLSAGRWDDEMEVAKPASHAPQATDWDAYRAEEDARIAELLDEESV